MGTNLRIFRHFWAGGGDTYYLLESRCFNFSKVISHYDCSWWVLGTYILMFKYKKITMHQIGPCIALGHASNRTTHQIGPCFTLGHSYHLARHYIGLEIPTSYLRVILTLPDFFPSRSSIEETLFGAEVQSFVQVNLCV